MYMFTFHSLFVSSTCTDGPWIDYTQSDTQKDPYKIIFQLSVTICCEMLSNEWTRPPTPKHTRTRLSLNIIELFPAKCWQTNDSVLSERWKGGEVKQRKWNIWEATTDDVESEHTQNQAPSEAVRFAEWWFAEDFLLDGSMDGNWTLTRPKAQLARSALAPSHKSPGKTSIASNTRSGTMS